MKHFKVIFPDDNTMDILAEEWDVNEDGDLQFKRYFLDENSSMQMRGSNLFSVGSWKDVEEVL